MTNYFTNKIFLGVLITAVGAGAVAGFTKMESSKQKADTTTSAPPPATTSDLPLQLKAYGDYRLVARYLGTHIDTKSSLLSFVKLLQNKDIEVYIDNVDGGSFILEATKKDPLTNKINTDKFLLEIDGKGSEDWINIKRLVSNDREIPSTLFPQVLQPYVESLKAADLQDLK